MSALSDTKSVSTPSVRNSTPKLDRTTFSTSRLAEFCSEKELVAQTGHRKEDWPLVVAKELVDNGLDACESAGVAPEITVTVDDRGITVADNGPGMPAETVMRTLDFNVRVSDKEAYVSPTRGAQGNALKTLVAMPFALDGDGGVEVAAHGVRHRIRMQVDPIRRQPIIEHEPLPDRDVKTGTCFTLRWPNSACLTLTRAQAQFLQLVDGYTWLNPHLALTVDWFGERKCLPASRPDWPKWRPSSPTSPHWYLPEHFERLIGAYIANDSDTGGAHSVSELMAEFKGLTGSAKRKALLAETGLARTNLADLVKDRQLDKHTLQRLLQAMKGASKPVGARDLGVIGQHHLRDRMGGAGCDLGTFKYKFKCGETNGLPWVVEVAFAARKDQTLDRRLVTGVNWSPAIGNPFGLVGPGESLDSILADQWAGQDEPVAILLHLACPRVEFRDRGKSSAVIEF